MSKADIQINGRKYSVACAPGQETRLRALGNQLNTRVKHISQAVGDIGDERLLLIAALALLDEVDAARQGQPTSADDVAATALTDAAARIEAIAARLETR